MSTFAQAVDNQTTTTTNGMRAFVNASDAVVDLFYKIGASRGQDIIPDFTAACVQDPELAVRVLLWSRDVRNGAGERTLFRKILSHLEFNYPALALRILPKIPELGRWDDIFSFNTNEMQHAAYTMLKTALENGDALAAKWCPREQSAKKELASEIRKFFGWSPKFYRKTLAKLTKVVESDMCSNKWDDINFSHVPSVASKNYRRAFSRHTDNYAQYLQALKSGDPTVKVNAGAIFPHDVVKSITRSSLSLAEREHIVAQWAALPNYVGDASILPLVDVSGSMTIRVPGSDLTCMDVAVSLGLYLSEKNTGKFKDIFVSFTETSDICSLTGDVVDRYHQIRNSDWGLSTNLHSAFENILKVAVDGNVPDSEMPKVLLILSDMQFDHCVDYDDSAIEMITRKYNDAGYSIPQVVFWNLNASDNCPVKANKSGAALVSGFSPSIVKTILSCESEKFSPRGIMLDTIMHSRYDF